MNEEIKKIIEDYTLNAYQVALISAGVSILTFIITNWGKNYFANKLLQSKLKIEHRFDQGKKIKEALAKYKVQLLTACEDLNHRFWNMSGNHHEEWLKVDGDYKHEHYYFHSTAYRILSLFAWIGKVKKEMIFLDTTIATKEDLEFITFLKVFPNVLCDLTFIVGKGADGEYAIDHFFRAEFELLPDCILDADGVKSYADYKKNIPSNQKDLETLYRYLDGVSPTEQRMRWDRLHLLHLTLIIFLNIYGYEFQKTIESKIEEVIKTPKVSPYTRNYFNFLKEYRLDKNKEVRRVENIARKYYV